jgi:hypothetical protein
MSITYKKLRSGEWGLRAEGVSDVHAVKCAHRNGTAVTVATKAGEQMTDHPRRILWCSVPGTCPARSAGAT